MKLVSLYFNAFHSGTDTKGQQAPEQLDIDIFLESIQNGLYEQRYNLSKIREAKSLFRVEEIRCEGFSKQEIQADKEYQTKYTTLKKLKDQIPRITVSGIFRPEGRSEGNLAAHSELIDIDIDKLEYGEVERLRTLLSQDKYTYACFKTCGGDGLALIFKIEASKHKECFEGIKEYLFNTYGIILDSAHANFNATRNVSYDPDAFLRLKCETFKAPIKKKKKEEPKQDFVYAKTDFDNCVKQIVGQQLDFCPDYTTYRDMGFAISNKFGLAGLDYFDAICSFGVKYDKAKIAKHYKDLCRQPEGKVKIATFFFRCKQLNIEIYSKETKIISAAASMAYKSGRTKEDVIKNLEIHEGFTPEQTTEIVNQVFDNKIEFISQSGILDDIQAYLKYNYSLKVNSITGKFENHGIEWNESDFNSCLIDVKKVFDKADAKWTERILFSSCIPSYNPIQDWFKEHEVPKISFHEGRAVIPDIIEKLWLSLETRSAYYTQKFGTKWLVGAISTWFGEPSPLELIFVGELSKGKTFFARHLLPDSWKKYYAEIKIDTTDNCSVIMCQKALINQNECGGRSNKDDAAHKDILDKDYFSIRRPYRRDPEDMKRLCALFGTSNKISDILTDRTGNRRIIATEIISRNFEEYDKIDKTELWMAVYALWKAGFDWQITSKEDIKELNQFSEGFEAHGLEYELINKHFEPCDEDDKDCIRMTASDIKVYIKQKDDQVLRLTVIAEELYRMKVRLVDYRTASGSRKKVYNLKPNMEINQQVKKDLPF